MNKVPLAPSDDAIRFPSLESLHTAHSDLLKEFRTAGDTANIIAKAEAFIMRGRATGALLDADADRWAAQSQLDYWATQLYRPGYEPPDATLDEFDPQLAPELDDSLCPYVGLDAFHERNQSVFFGRQRLVDELLRKLAAARFLAVLGSSGSGKSSVVRAGLIPALKLGALPGSADWQYCAPLVPGSNPLENLARVMIKPSLGTSESESDASGFRRDPAYLAHIVSERFQSNVLLVVDQFEEIFTLCTDEVDRTRFVDNLLYLCQQPGASHRVIITMRSDFENNIVRLSSLQAAFDEAAVRVTPLNASELREAIEAPAARIGLKFEEGVVNALLNDTLGEPAALPLLQFTLLKLWENRERNRITWEAYKRLGGGRQALAHSADDFYTHLIPEEQVTMRRILLKMVRPGEGLEVTSNRVSRNVLYQKAEANDRLDRVLDKLIHAHLVRVSEGDIAADEQVEVAHEALVRNWPRLVEWLEEDRVALRQRQRLTISAEEWQRLGRDPSALWRGVFLTEARRYDDLSSLEADFLEASYTAERAEAERSLIEQRRQEELKAAQELAEVERLRASEQAESAAKLQRGRLYLIGTLGVVIVLAVIAGVSGLRARQASAEAQRQALIARAGELAAQSVSLRGSQFDLSLLLSAEADQTDDTARARNVLLENTQTNPQLLQYLRTTGGKVTSVAFSPDGKILASGSDDSTITLWDVNARKPMGNQLADANGGVTTLAFSPDGKILASGSGDGIIILWDVITQQPIQDPLAGHKKAVTDVAFSPDGNSLASGSEDGTVVLWDVKLHQVSGQPLAGNTRVITSVAFSPDGKVLIAGGCSTYDSPNHCIVGEIDFWDSVSHQANGQPLIVHNGSVTSIALSPDGKVLASGSDDNDIILWNMGTQQPIGQPLKGHTGPVTSVTFSPDGKTLASGSEDRAIFLWSAVTQQPTSSPISAIIDQSEGNGQIIGHALYGHQSAVTCVTFSPDGSKFASGSEDTTIILWSSFPRQPIVQPLIGHTAPVTSVAFSPDGKMVASGSADNTIILWDVRAQRPIGQPLIRPNAPVTSVAFSPDGKMLASGSADKTIILWDLVTREPIDPPLIGHKDFVTSIAMSPDGRMLASGSADKTIILWDMTTRQPIGEPLRGHTNSVRSVAFSPDGKTLASGGDDNVIILWDIATRQPVGHPLAGHTGAVTSVAFNPSGNILASGSEDAKIILWNVVTHQQVGLPLVGHESTISSVSFSPDGKILASGGWDHKVILWDVTSGQVLARPLIGHTNAVNSVAFSPDGKNLVSGSNDTTISFWSIDSKDWIKLVCSTANRNLTRVEWARYINSDPSTYRATCDSLPIESQAAASTKIAPSQVVSMQPTAIPLQSVSPRVLVLVFDPVIDTATGEHASEYFKANVDALISGYTSDIDKLSGGLVKYQIVKKLEISQFPVFVDGYTYDSSSWLQLIKSGSSPHQPGGADYEKIIQEYGISTMVAKGEINEVWLFGAPYSGFDECRIAGQAAFWCYAPPIETNGPRYVIMGFSYQRSVGEMLHSFGHRAENLMARVYNSQDFLLWASQPNRSPATISSGQTLNLFERFILFDQIAPGQANVGLVHNPPNAERDYDYANNRLVPSAADDWLHFPNLPNPPKYRQMNSSEWGGGDDRLYMEWWLAHLPKAGGTTDGISNNWWSYIIDPNLP